MRLDAADREHAFSPGSSCKERSVKKKPLINFCLEEARPSRPFAPARRSILARLTLRFEISPPPSEACASSSYDLGILATLNESEPLECVRLDCSACTAASRLHRTLERVSSGSGLALKHTYLLTIETLARTASRASA